MIQSISESTERQSSGRMFKRKLQGIYPLRPWEYLKVSPSKYVSDRQIATHAEGCGIAQARRKKSKNQGGTRMSATNGRAHGRDATTTMSGPPPTAKEIPATRYSVEGVKQLVAALEVPFDPSQIEWRVVNTTKNRQPVRGQVIPYADQRAYNGPLKCAVHAGGLDAQIRDSSLREFRAEQRSENCREGSGYLRADHFWPRLAFGPRRRMGRRR